MNVRNTVCDLKEICIKLHRNVESVKDEIEKEKIALTHVKAYADTGLKINEFPKDFKWFNVSESLSLHEDLHGKIVIIDFFTYSCLKCLHVLDDLHTLQESFSIQDGLVVVGVHSAKFLNLRESSKTLLAVQRYKVKHPVVSDPEYYMFGKLFITDWPTLLIIGPSGQPLFALVDEGHRDELFLYTKVTLEYFKSLNQISNKCLPIKIAEPISPMTNSSLLFPGKIHSYKTQSGEKVVVSDTDNNRILINSHIKGKVEHVIGGSSSGFKHGRFEKARFNAPQGVCVLNDDVFVADSGNHAIRKINLKKKTVTTIAGTGVQGHDYVGGKIGRNQVLSHPWDVDIYHHEHEGKTVPVVLIAMAGTHQIWALFLEDTVWWKKKAEACVRIVGDGRRANLNHSDPHQASLAQPSGLAVAQELKLLFFANSQSSSIRKVCLVSGKVTFVCGADDHPQNLLNYGDRDGKASCAYVRYPLGLAWNRVEKMIYIADTYNHKVKKTDAEGNCVTVCGAGKPSKNHVFDEPNGLTVRQDGEMLYVADTYNHCIKSIYLREVQQIKVIPIDIPDEAQHRQEESVGAKNS